MDRVAITAAVARRLRVTRMRGLLMLAGLALAACATVISASAQAVDFEIAGFDGAFLNADRSAASQAGSHPHWAGAFVTFTSQPDPLLGGPVPPVNVRRIEAHLPPGLVGDPTAVPTCTMAEVTAPFTGTPQCQPNTQVGVLALNGGIFGQSPSMPTWGPLYNVPPPPGAAAAFATTVAGVPAVLTAKVRPDGGVMLLASDLSEAVPLVMTGTQFWGVPADPSHDLARHGKGTRTCLLFSNNGFPDAETQVTLPEACPAATAVPAGIPRKPFVTLPTSCTPGDVGLETRVTVESWRGHIDQTSFFSHLPVPNESTQLGTSGCDRLRFDPAVSVQPTTRQADAPTGLDVEITVPQDENPEGLVQSHLRKAVVTFPEGMTISPSSVDGLQACSDAQLGLGSVEPARCPDGSKIGSVSVDTPLLEEQLAGSVFVRTQNSDDPTSGELFRIVIEIRNDLRGIDLKLPGAVRADARTGRLEATVDNSPQVPFSRFRLHFKGGPRAPLATPPTCGSHAISAELTPWSGNPPVRLSDSFEIDCPGQQGFAPAFDAGAIAPTGGAFSPFAVRIDRPDREEYLAGVALELPLGVSAKLKGVPLCSDGNAAAGTCSPGTRVGTATVGAGPGSNPYYLRGSVSLGGPYKGAPYSLSIAVPVKAGPFDLGTEIVRQAIEINPETAQLRVISDPLPQVVKGVPVRLRSANVDVDRPRFALNPTACSEKRIEATFTSIVGTIYKASRRFGASDCASLAFRPKLTMRLSGRGQTRTGGHPGLAATLRQASGEANTALARVTLPPSIALDAVNSYDPKLVCDYDASLKADCPQSTAIGRATARTPVLNSPLSGDVHLVQGIRFGPKGNRIRTTPSLLVKLRGEVSINLRARSNVRHGRLVTTFSQIPDAPVSRFHVRINGGSKGILVVTRTRKGRINLCAAKQRAAVQTKGQNGKRAVYGATVKTPCVKRGKARR